jgi:NitT/TauT family transport system permease protein
MTFSFYQSMRTLPKELVEATNLFRLSRWQRFTRLELPTAAIPLLWNAMMSFGGVWFFVAASEAISVLNHDDTLPGIGSYVADAIAAKDLSAIGWAMATMALVILLVDQVFWRPLVAWSDRYRLELSGSGTMQQSWVYDLVTTARIPRLMATAAAPILEVFDELMSGLFGPVNHHYPDDLASPGRDRLFNLFLWLLIGTLLTTLLHFILTQVGIV